MSVELTRLVPKPAGPTTVRESYAVERGRAATRPWVALCMVASLDGSVALDGSSGGLGNAHDREILLTLRDLSDVILVGAGTALGEGYGPPRSGRRIGVVTNTGRVDLASDLFRSGAAFVIAPEAAPLDTESVDVLRSGAHTVDLADAISRLGEQVPEPRHVHVEGGPTLNGSLLAVGLVDELALTTSPRMVGGVAPRLTTHSSEVDERFELAHALVDEESYLFTRWVRR